MTTKHTCNGGRGPVFGRKTKGCPRCFELEMGLPAVQWSRREQHAQRCREIKAHFASHKHQSGGCGPVCTFAEW